MPLFANQLPFFLSTIFAAGILYFIPFSDSKVALQRLSTQIQPDTRVIRTIVKENCDTLIAESRAEEFLAKSFLPNQVLQPKRLCRLNIQETFLSRFHLVTRWNYGISIFTPDDKLLLEKLYEVQFPKPLILLPVIIFFLSLFYEFSFWSFGFTASTYLFLLFGLDFIHAIHQTTHAFSLVIETDKTWLGLCLLVIFLQIAKNRTSALSLSAPGLTRLSPGRLTLHRALLGATGLWNPAFFTVFSLLLLPLKASFRRLKIFFDGQVVVCALSLYLLASHDMPSWDLVKTSLLLPRYFSFTFFLMVFLTYANPRAKKQMPVWRLPDIRLYCLAVLVEEIASLFIPLLRAIPTLSRVSLTLLVVELSLHKRIQWKTVFARSVKPISGILVCVLLSILSAETGVTDMALALCQPQLHPTALVLFTYFSGLLLGILTGSFSAAFFVLLPHLATVQVQPIVRAALLDGILAGNLLSPFSLFNIVPAAILGINFQHLIRFRVKQLWLPLCIGGAIYAVSAVNSVAILRPVTFLFLCLVAAAVKLRKSEWRIGRAWPWESYL